MSNSIKNFQEAAAVKEIVEALVSAGLSYSDIGIVTPYSAQVKLIHDLMLDVSPNNISSSDEKNNEESLNRQGSNDTKKQEEERKTREEIITRALEVRSVDGYQGREKEVIVLSAVRSNADGKVGFLSDWRRLNVALTRARRGLLVVGDPRTLARDPNWAAFWRWAQTNGVAADRATLGLSSHCYPSTSSLSSSSITTKNQQQKI